MRRCQAGVGWHTGSLKAKSRVAALAKKQEKIVSKDKAIVRVRQL